MRGADVTQKGLFVTKQTSDYIPAGHPLIAIREILNRALREMDGLFESILVRLRTRNYKSKRKQLAPRGKDAKVKPMLCFSWRLCVLARECFFWRRRYPA